MEDAMNEEIEELRIRIEALKPGEEIVWDGELKAAIAMIQIMPLGKTGGTDFRLYDNPRASGHVIRRRPDFE
jgi:hypothetical protein